MLGNKAMAAVVPATDLERAKQFYSETLGLRPTEVSAPATILFESGDGTSILLYEREQGTQADHTAALWLVDDVEQTVQDLSNKGVEFERYDMPNLKTDQRGIVTMGESQVAWFKDTEGNILAVTTPS